MNKPVATLPRKDTMPHETILPECNIRMQHLEQRHHEALEAHSKDCGEIKQAIASLDALLRNGLSARVTSIEINSRSNSRLNWFILTALVGNVAAIILLNK